MSEFGEGRSKEFGRDTSDRKDDSRIPLGQRKKRDFVSSKVEKMLIDSTEKKNNQGSTKKTGQSGGRRKEVDSEEMKSAMEDIRSQARQRRRKEKPEGGLTRRDAEKRLMEAARKVEEKDRGSQEQSETSQEPMQEEDGSEE